MNSPKLRFKIFNGNWKMVKLKDVVEIVGGGTPSTLNNEFWNGEIQWFTPSEIGKQKYVSKSVRTITKLGLEKSSAKLLPKGTILLTTRASLGDMAITLEEVTTNQGFQSLICMESINENFLYYQQPKIKQHCYNQSSGSTFLEISKANLGNCFVALTSLEEQVKIGKFLSLLDLKIQKQQEKIDLLKELKKGYMQKIFSQELRFKDVNVQEYPAWRKVKLGKLTKKTGKKNSEGVKYPVAAISNKKGFTLEGDRNYSNADVDISTYKLVHKNEFAYNPARINVGSFGFQNVTDVAIVSSLYVIFENLPSLSNAYLKAYMHSRYFNQDVIRNTEGSVREYLFYENFSNIKIPLPCLEEQEKIATFLLKLDSKIQLEEQKFESLQEQKKWFMQQMFI